MYMIFEKFPQYIRVLRKENLKLSLHDKKINKIKAKQFKLILIRTGLHVSYLLYTFNIFDHCLVYFCNSVQVFIVTKTSLSNNIQYTVHMNTWILSLNKFVWFIVTIILWVRYVSLWLSQNLRSLRLSCISGNLNWRIAKIVRTWLKPNGTRVNVAKEYHWRMSSFYFSQLIRPWT